MLNSLLRLPLVLWVLGYLLVSCGGLFSGSAGAAAGGLLAGTVLLVPWLVGVLARDHRLADEPARRPLATCRGAST